MVGLSPDAIPGLAIALTVNLLVPIVLLILLTRVTSRLRRSAETHRAFWFWTSMYLAGVAVVAGAGIVDVLAYRGMGVVAAVVVTLPFGLVPAVVDSLFLERFFSLADWTHVGYHVVLLSLVVGLVPWAAVNALTGRLLLQAGRSADRRAAVVAS